MKRIVDRKIVEDGVGEGWTQIHQTSFDAMNRSGVGRRINGRGVNMDVEKKVDNMFKLIGVWFIVVAIIISGVIFGVIKGCQYVQKNGLKNVAASIMEGDTNATNATNEAISTNEVAPVE